MTDRSCFIVAKAGVGTHQWNLTIGDLISNRFLEVRSFREVCRYSDINEK